MQSHNMQLLFKMSIYEYCRVGTGHPVELKYIPEADQLIKICHRRLRVPLNLDATQTLPKTNSILNIINNDQRIQVSFNA